MTPHQRIQRRRRFRKRHMGKQIGQMIENPGKFWRLTSLLMLTEAEAMGMMRIVFNHKSRRKAARASGAWLGHFVYGGVQ